MIEQIDENTMVIKLNKTFLLMKTHMSIKMKVQFYKGSLSLIDQDIIYFI